MSGYLDPSRIPLRSSLARATGREEKASMFCVMREKRDVSANCCIAWLGACLENTGAHSRLDGLKPERWRWQSLAAMGGRYASVRISGFDKPWDCFWRTEGYVISGDLAMRCNAYEGSEGRQVGEGRVWADADLAAATATA